MPTLIKLCQLDETQKTINDAIYDTIDYLKLEIEKGNVDPATFMKDINTKDLKI